jgi:hypothetical protein
MEILHFVQDDSVKFRMIEGWGRMTEGEECLI